MPSEFYFMAVGGLGVTLAGFAGLISALQGRSGPVATWRIRNVVFQGFTVTLLGFGTVALFSLTEDVTLTVRLVSAVMVLTRLARWGEFRPSPAWRSERQRRSAVILEVGFGSVAVANVVLASLGLLQLLLLVLLLSPAGIFANAVRDATRDDAGLADAADDPKD